MEKKKQITKSGGGIPSGFKLYINHWFADTYEDDYENGEGEHVNYFDGTINKEFDNINDLISHICDHVLYKDVKKSDFSVIDNRITTSFLVDENSSHATKQDMEMWKNGKRKLYSVIYDFPIEFISRKNITEEKLSELMK